MAQEKGPTNTETNPALLTALLTLCTMTLAGMSQYFGLGDTGINTLTGKPDLVNIAIDYGPTLFLTGAITIETLANGFQHSLKSLVGLAVTAAGAVLGSNIASLGPAAELGARLGLPIAVRGAIELDRLINHRRN